VPRVSGALIRFWQAEKSLSALLVLLVFSELILPAVAPESGPRDPLTGAFFSCVLMAGAASVWQHAPRAVRAVAILCLLAPVAWWAAWFDPGGALAVWRPAACSGPITAS
jgi:hypothetical protein